ncbi:MAG TPA: hypothetical protein VF472_07475 [Burkholderiaceae bacterium]
MNAALWIRIAVGTVGYSAWACMAFFDRSLLPDFLKFNIAMAVGTIGLALRDMPPAVPVPALSPKTGEADFAERKEGAQAGHAKPLLLGLIALGLAVPVLAMRLAPLPEQAISFLWCGRHPGEPPCHS